MDQFASNPNDIKSHEEIDNLINDIKHVEHEFENLDFLKDLPVDIPLIEPEPTIQEATLEPQPVQQIENPKEIESVQPPDELTDRMPQRQFSSIHSIHTFVNNKLVYPIFKTPDVGHTTFTLQIKDNNIQGFYKLPEQTKDLKDLVSDAKSTIPGLKETISSLPSRFKAKIKDIQEKGLKNELKNLPTKIITPIKNINIATLKQMPKKLRNIFSSDKD